MLSYFATQLLTTMVDIATIIKVAAILLLLIKIIFTTFNNCKYQKKSIIRHLFCLNNNFQNLMYYLVPLFGSICYAVHCYARFLIQDTPHDLRHQKHDGLPHGHQRNPLVVADLLYHLKLFGNFSDRLWQMVRAGCPAYLVRWDKWNERIRCSVISRTLMEKYYIFTKLY